MTSRRARVRTRDLVIVGLLVAGLVAGMVLVITGGTSDDGPAGDGSAPGASIPFDRVSLEQIEEWSGLDVPAGAEEFWTARISDTQLDVTFTMSGDDEAAFVSGSGLPEPVAGERQVLHSSPLWKLNPGAGSDEAEPDEIEPDEGGPTTGPTVPGEEPDPDTEPVADLAVRATADTHGGIRRAVELVDEGADTVRARIVLSAG